MDFRRPQNSVYWLQLSSSHVTGRVAPKFMVVVAIGFILHYGEQKHSSFIRVNISKQGNAKKYIHVREHILCNELKQLQQKE